PARSAGAHGVQPGNGGTRRRRLPTWRRPNPIAAALPEMLLASGDRRMPSPAIHRTVLDNDRIGAACRPRLGATEPGAGSRGTGMAAALLFTPLRPVIGLPGIGEQQGVADAAQRESRSSLYPAEPGTEA